MIAAFQHDNPETTLARRSWQADPGGTEKWRNRAARPLEDHLPTLPKRAWKRRGSLPHRNAMRRGTSRLFLGGAGGVAPAVVSASLDPASIGTAANPSAPTAVASDSAAVGSQAGNAVTETLFGSLKIEWLHGTRRQAKVEVMDWITFYNYRRLHSTLGYASPMAFEQKWLAAQISLAA